jgi:hypothetical protein
MVSQPYIERKLLVTQTSVHQEGVLKNVVEAHTHISPTWKKWQGLGAV